LKTFFLSLAGAFVALVLFLVVSALVIAGVVAAAAGGDDQPEQIILELDLREELADQAPTSGLAAFSGEIGFTDILVRLDAAREDEDVKGLFLRAPDLGMSSARAEELRDALAAFRESGRFVIAHSQGSFFNLGPSGLRSISAADEIWVQPGSDLIATGIVFEVEFVRGLLDKLSITPQIEQFHEYKNSPNTYKNETLTQPHREALAELADSVWSVSLGDIASDRGLQPGVLRTSLESGPLPAGEVVEAGIADKTGWPEDARDAAQARAGDAAFLSVMDYAPPKASPGAPILAVVGGEGAIVTGGGEDDPFASTVGFGSDRVARAILDAAENERVEAIVFRVDSPGGSPTASDQIWNAVEHAQEAGKPVIVSMGRVAASGGYYVSAGADQILASETTITGSIGIFGGKLAFGEGLEKIGVNVESVKVGGDYTGAYGVNRFTETQRNTLRQSLQRGYDRFIRIVSEGRGLTTEEVDARARGRVWSGADALDNGLVDSQGGFLDAILVAKELAGIDPETRARLLHFPARQTGFEALDSLFGASAATARSASHLHDISRQMDLLTRLEEIQAMKDGTVRMQAPPIRER